MSSNVSELSLRVAKRDFLLFCKLVLKQKVGDMHRQMIRTATEDPRHLVIMAARGHFKTTTMSVAFPLWIAFGEREKPDDILLISSSLDQATKNIKILKRTIEQNPILNAALFPDSRNATWSATELELKNGWRIKAVPFGDSVRGNHPRYAILDDILRDETTNIEESKNKFYGVVYPIVQAKKGKIVLVGTPMSYEDLFNELAAKTETFAFLKFPALKADGTAQFPEHFSLEQLEKIRASVPAGMWSREYMCEPVSGGSALFPRDVIEACIAAKVEPREGTIVVGYDVAVTEEKRSDYSAYSVIKVTDGQPYDVLEVRRFKLSTDKQVAVLREIAQKYSPAKILIEQTGVGAGLVQLAKADPYVGTLIEEFNTQSKKNELVGQLEVTMRQRAVKIPNDSDLILELESWENTKDKSGRQIAKCMRKHDDLSMSLALATWCARSYGLPVGAVGIDAKEVKSPFEQRNSDVTESFKNPDDIVIVGVGSDSNDGQNGYGDSRSLYTYG